MIVTNLSLYRKYKLIIGLVSADIRCDFERFDVKTKIIRSQFLSAWEDIQCIISNHCRDPDTSLFDREIVNEFSSEIYRHTMVLIEEKEML
jgi:hypothetical protein